jgi:hypothetical protein
MCSDEVEPIALVGVRGSDYGGTTDSTDYESMRHGQKYQSAIGASKPGRRNYLGL